MSRLALTMPPGNMPSSSMWRRIRRPWKRLKVRSKTCEQTSSPTPSRFFDLPGELRRLIYHELLIEEKRFPDDEGLTIRVKKLLDPSMMLVNHEFGKEYFDEAEERNTIVLEDTARFGWTPISLPSALQYVRKVEVHVRLFCMSMYHLDADSECYVAKELRNHRNWLQEMTALLPTRKLFIIHAYLEPRSNCVGCQRTLLDRQTALTTLDDLTALHVYESYMDHSWVEACDNVFKNVKTQVMEYDSTKEALVEVEDRRVSDNCDSLQAVGDKASLSDPLR